MNQVRLPFLLVSDANYSHQIDNPPKEFWDALGGQLELPVQGADDATMEREWNSTDKLWRYT